MADASMQVVLTTANVLRFAVRMSGNSCKRSQC